MSCDNAELANATNAVETRKSFFMIAVPVVEVTDVMRAAYSTQIPFYPTPQM
jgi:hypothetical protein